MKLEPMYEGVQVLKTQIDARSRCGGRGTSVGKGERMENRSHPAGEQIRPYDVLPTTDSASLQTVIATLTQQNERLQVLVTELLMKNQCLRSGIDSITFRDDKEGRSAAWPPGEQITTTL
jgi:hypothetical protein